MDIESVPTERLLAEKMIQAFRSKGNLPKNINVAKVADRYWVECHDVKSDSLMSDQSTTGFSKSPDVALMKALSERVEYQAFIEGHHKGLKSCSTERSDGFAAYPKLHEDALLKVRDAALSEAIERFVWSTWWDNEKIGFELNTLRLESVSAETLKYANQITSECQLAEFFIIRPKVQNLSDKTVIILIGHLKSGGFISGGACGSDVNEVILRSLDELYRHGLAVVRLNENKIVPKSFYEKRLAFFGLGQGSELVAKRLAAQGAESIILPNLAIDEEIDHFMSDDYFVHRCLFENQPPFIGGKLERLCL